MALLRHAIARGGRLLSALRTARVAMTQIPVLAPLEECVLPAAITDLVACPDPGRPFVFREELLPRRASDLPRLVALMRAARAQLHAGDVVIWTQPTQTAPLLSIDETAQVIGLIGQPDEIVDLTEGERSWRVAVATARPEAAALALRWSLAALAELGSGRGSDWREMITRFGAANALHAVELPDAEAKLAPWSEHLRAFCEFVGRDRDLIWGAVLPPCFAKMPALMDEVVMALRSQTRAVGVRAGPCFQWVRGSVPLSASEAILDFARRHDIAFDFTPMHRGSSADALRAYDDTVPYHALRFDLRLPSFAADKSLPVELARWSQMPSPDWVDEEFERQCARLKPALDRDGQHRYRLRVERDPALMQRWPQHFVYNWASPAPARLRLVEVDAGSLDLDAPGAPRWTGAGRFLDIGREAARRSFGLPLAAKELQIKEHTYQAMRDDITADAVRLIAWMPAALGRTLELGSGMGVMARRIAGRTRLYIGIDLTTAQALALRPLGGRGLVADIHALPFPGAAFDTIIADNVIEHAVDPLAVLIECHRVLRPGGRAFLVIPPDYASAAFRNSAHFWKADVSSVCYALERAGFTVMRHETVRLAELGVSGAFPSSQGATDLWQVEKPSPHGGMRGAGGSR